MLYVLALTLAIVTPPYIESATSCEYLVLTPQNVRPKTPLKIPIHFGKATHREKVTAKLIQLNRDGMETTEKIKAEKTIDVPNGEMAAEIELMPPPKMSWGTSFRLNISATGNVEFENSTSIYGRPRAHAIFVQTDKKKYKPTDIVRYRVFIVNSRLDLAAPTFKVEIFDPKGNKMAKLEDQRDKYGIENSFALTPGTPLGNWRIEVTVEAFDESESYYFDVEEYVLPKFEVIVTLPKFGLMTDSALTGSVTAKYTFGKQVNGTLVLTLSKRYGSGFHDPAAIRTEAAIDGTASINVPMDLVGILSRRMSSERILVHANVTETLTGITQEGQAEIQYYSSSFSITYHPNLPDNFKPGFNPYEVWLKITQQDDRPPVITESDKLKVSVSYFTEMKLQVRPPNSISIQNFDIISPFSGGDVVLLEPVFHPIGADGVVKFPLAIPNEAATVSIKAEFKDATATKELRRFRTIGNEVLGVDLVDGNTKSLVIGDPATFRVTAPAGATNVHYLIISRGQIVDSGPVNIGRKDTNGNVQVIVSREMAPTAKFVVYYVKADGEILADGINVVVDDIFENKVAISFVEPSPQEPNSSVTLKVTAAQESMVNVLAVDKSVILLAQGNDIDKERVEDKMAAFGDSPWFPRHGWGHIIPPWPVQADDPNDVFINSRLNVMTDCNLYKFDLWRVTRKEFSTSMRSGVAAFSADNMAMGGRSGGGGAAPQPSGNVRRNFLETWIWKSAIAVNGVATFNEFVPDTITDFVASAFALDTKTGLGVATTRANMTVFLPFFVVLQMPYSAVRGETVIIQASVFNYRDDDVNAVVVLKGHQTFVGVTVDRNGQEVEQTGDIVRCVNVKANSAAPVFFSVRPTTIGMMDIIVNATVPPPANIFDEVQRSLSVVAEGISKEQSFPTLFVLTGANAGTKSATVQLPAIQNLVPASARLYISIFGDLLGTTMINMDGLIRIPQGNGELIQAIFAPRLYIVKYLNATNRLENATDFVQSMKRALEIGYQRQLVYRRDDGSFSEYGNADDEGSVWLTAFVMKSFAQAKSLDLIFIDPNVLDKAVRFINRNQGIDGLIINVGSVRRRELQGSSDSSIRSLSAYVLISLLELRNAQALEDPETTRLLDDTIRRLTDALVQVADQITGDYELAIASYALKLANSPKANDLLTKLRNSPTKKETDSSLYWDSDSAAKNVEIASYALLTYVTFPDLQDSWKIVNWLVQQRNSYGGFFSTQDTVLGLQALSEFAVKTYTDDINLEIDVTTVKGNVESAPQKRTLTSANHDVLQFISIPDGEVDSVKITVKGNGTALIDVARFYNVKSETSTTFALTTTVLDATENKYTLKVCARLIDSTANSSNTVVIDVGAVSGFEPNKDQVPVIPPMKHRDINSGRLVMFFDEIPKTDHCVEIPFQRVTFVANVKPASVVMYPIDEPYDRIMKEYIPDNLNQSNLCNTCPGCCSSEQTCRY